MASLKPAAGTEAAASAGQHVTVAGEGAGRRAVGHALADLRRGLPCVVMAAGGRIAAAPAETVDARGLAELRALLGGAPPWLLLAPSRAGVLAGLEEPAGEVAALALDPALLQPATLRALADPSLPQPHLRPALAVVAAPPGALACLALAKRARLLPAMLAGPMPEGRDAGEAVAVAADEAVLAGADDTAALARVAEAAVPLADAPDSRVVAFRGGADGLEHLAVLVGRPEAAPQPLVRVHSECFTGDLLGSLRCDCGPQLRGAIRRMADEGAGVLLYLAQEGRGIGLVNKLRAYALQDRGMDTLDANRALGWGADERDYAVAAAMLRLLGVARVRLLTNNPRKVSALARGGIEVARVSHLFASNGVNDTYLATKVARFGHLAD